MALLDFLKNKKEAEKAKEKKVTKASVAKESKPVKAKEVKKEAIKEVIKEAKPLKSRKAHGFSYEVVKEPHISEKSIPVIPRLDGVVGL